MSIGIHQALDIPFPHIEGVRIALPRIDVVIGNYNQGQFVRDAIRSVAQQSYANFQCVIVDDKSTDESVDIIQETLRELGDIRFRFIASEENGGQMATMYRGFDTGTAPFVAFLDADDVWLPTFLETHLGCHLNPEINAALSSCNLATIDAAGVLISGVNPVFAHCNPWRDSADVSSINISVLRCLHPAATRPHNQAVFIRNSYGGWSWSPTSSFLFRRVVLDTVRPDNVSDFPMSADSYLARFCHLIGGSIVIRDVCGYYRIHGRNGWSKRTIYGDGIHSGDTNPVIEAAAKRAMLKKLSGSGISGPILTASHSSKMLLQIAKTYRDYAILIKSSYRNSQVPKSFRKKLRRRTAKAAFRKLIQIRAA